MKISYLQTNDQLLHQLLIGDRKAQWTLFEKMQRKMLALCRRYIRDDFEAENCMMEGFARVFQQINSFKQDGSLEGWVRKIIVRQCLMQLRKNGRMLFDPVHEIFPEPAFTIPSGHDYAFLLGLVHRLPDGYRTVFNLFAIEGYAHAEIAELLGISEGTSKSQLSAARILLKKMLMKEGIKHSNHFAI